MKLKSFLPPNSAPDRCNIERVVKALHYVKGACTGNTAQPNVVLELTADPG